MKKIKTTDIIVGSAMPLKSGSLDHLQSAYREDELDIIQAFEARNDVESTPNFTTPVIMYGCRWNGAAVSSGALVYGTEIFRAPLVLITLGLGQVIIGTITTTYLTATNADPVTFSDSTSNNVHEIRQIVWSAGVSGSGDFDFDDCLMWGRWFDVNYSPSYLAAQTGTWTIASSADWQVKWKQTGRTLIVDFLITNSSISLTTQTLTLSLPFNANFKNSHNSLAWFQYTSPSVVQYFAKVTTTPSTTDIVLFKDSPYFTGATNNFDVGGQITIELDKF